MISRASDTPQGSMRNRCAIYTRKSHAEGLEQDFNSLDAQRESCLAYIASHRQEGWEALHDRFDDGGVSGGTLERRALQRLLKDVEAGLVNCIVVYKIDRLSRALADFVKLLDLFDQHQVSFVSVTQSIDTSTSTGRLMLNVLFSFAQFEREQTADRIRDKIAAAKAKGKYCGGVPPLGYDVVDGRLEVNDAEAKLVRRIFRRYLVLRSATKLMQELNANGYLTKSWTTKKGDYRPGRQWNRAHVYRVLNDRKYIGEITHKKAVYKGEQKAVVQRDQWDEVQAVLAENTQSRGRAVRAESPALLRDVIRCGTHDRAMGPSFTRKNGRSYNYYTCRYASKHGHGECPTPSVSAGVVEEAVVHQLRAVFRSPEMIAKTFAAAKKMGSSGPNAQQSEKKELEGRLEALKATAAKALGNGRGGPVGERVEDLTAEIREVEYRLEEVSRRLAIRGGGDLDERDVADALTRLDPVWDELFPAEQARIVKLLVEKVVVTPSLLEIRIRAGGLHSLVSELGHEGIPVEARAG